MQELRYGEKYIANSDQHNSLFNTLNTILTAFELNTAERIQENWKYAEFNFVDYANKNAMYFLIRKLIYIAKWEKSTLDDDRTRVVRIKKHVNMFLNLPEGQIDIIVDILLRLVDEISSNTLKSNDAEKSLREYAKTNQLKCYICGSKISYDGVIDKRKLTLEHLIPSSLGGNKSIDNLFIACKECNEVKSNYLSWSEFDLTRYNLLFLDITKDEDRRALNLLQTQEDYKNSMQQKFELKINKHVIYLVSNLSKHACGHCPRSVDDIDVDEVYIMKKEDELPCNPFNLTLICNNCLDEYNNIGIEISPIKRISNV